MPHNGKNASHSERDSESAASLKALVLVGEAQRDLPLETIQATGPGTDKRMKKTKQIFVQNIVINS